jgi:hypothetical protein
LPTIHWTPVEGAVSYTVHAEDTVGADANYNVTSPVTTPGKITGTGIMHVSARANFPTSGTSTVSSAFFDPVAITKTLGPVKNPSGVKKGKRALITWDPDPSAKAYDAQISTTDGFGTTIESVRTSNPDWAPVLRRSPGGRLYWRVTPIDDANGHGAYASGSFVFPKAMTLTVVGGLRKRHPGRLTVLARDSKHHALRKVRLTISGAGIATRRVKTNRRGTAVVTIRPRKSGKVTVVGRLKGFADGSKTITVR